MAWPGLRRGDEWIGTFAAAGCANTSDVVISECPIDWEDAGTSRRETSRQPFARTPRNDVLTGPERLAGEENLGQYQPR